MTSEIWQRFLRLRAFTNGNLATREKAMRRRYDEYDDGDYEHDLGLEDARERKRHDAIMHCKGDPSECSCPDCNPPEDER